MARFQQRLAGTHRLPAVRHVGPQGGGRRWAGLPALAQRIITVGAVAGALAAILSLFGVPRLWPAPDPEDVASITKVSVSSPVTFSDYVAWVRSEKALERSTRTAFIVPATSDASAVLQPADGSPGSPGSPGRATGPSPSAAESSRATTEPSPDRATPDDGPTAGGAATSSVGSVPMSEAEIRVNATTLVARIDPRLMQHLKSVVDDAVPRVFSAPGGPLEHAAAGPDQGKMPPIAYAVAATAVNPDGTVASADTAARRVLKILRNARRDPKTGQPLGVIVNADVDLLGLRGQPLELSWSMWHVGAGAPLNSSWLNRNLAFRLKAGADHDRTSQNIWVPLPRRHGPYTVRVVIDGRQPDMDSSESPEFG